MNATPLIALQHLQGIGPKTTLKVASEVPSDLIEFKDYVELKFSCGEQEALRAWDQARQIMDGCEELDISPVAVTDEDRYPERLHSLQAEKPPVLYIKGSIDSVQYNSEVIAIVGTRNPTENGIRTAYDFGRVAAENHIPVVSGLAYGCDAHGHQGCLEYGGIAIAVMAHGLDTVYPLDHQKLAYQIVEENGCLVSEYPPGTKSAKWSFVARDRLQSGLSDIVIVIQTGKQGGTHHTAKFAQKQGRKILCVRPRASESDHASVQGTYDIVRNRDAEWIENPEDLLPGINGKNGPSDRVNREVRQLEIEF